MSDVKDIIDFEIPKLSPSIIMVTGVGGGGSNAVNHMFELEIADVSFMVCNTDPQRVRFLSEAGFTRVILERALSLGEIGRLSRAADVEIETFVHGAICVSYSGRCYMSRTMGPRSGNRGDCSQSCRLPYDLLDERMRPLERNRHLLSLQDMNATGQIEELIGAGVTSFKIEGRLKD
mgnify:FL=1